ncbi:hypothetical protein EP47_02400 [Legionella norrlandica]|uniref:Uncharacterized protein n=1 Tax=Legionella norrlandica TaxID=1498499 RepID=A0A0A2SRR3_9GAMM|nr:hypothetical protein [Legionella norrlandica]KGP63417.1 hypothetical protein EP47_02400 [Legionella norrlandica]
MESFIFKEASLLKLIIAFTLLIGALILVTPVNAKAVNRDINPIINKATPAQVAYWVRYRYWGPYPRYYRYWGPYYRYPYYYRPYYRYYYRPYYYRW